MENKIEGRIETGKSVVVIEDLVSTGKSSLAAVDALREAGCDVKGMAAIFSYDLDISRENFEKKDCRLITLSDYNILVQKAAEQNYISEKDVKALIAWRENPKKWGR